MTEFTTLSIILIGALSLVNLALIFSLSRRLSWLEKDTSILISAVKSNQSAILVLSGNPE